MDYRFRYIKFALVKYTRSILLNVLLTYFRSNISAGDSSNTSNCDWDWGNDTKQASKTITSKRQLKAEKKDDSLINFETDNKAQQNWNTKAEDDAWEILNN